ncbi:MULTISPECIES: dihydrofolate reductase [unclassified Chelatococcus]|uniref:dihydrofolate reductase n=1 Tax=unclassified Chelatococcus TaxID=2638111 RepID=UPI001BD17F8C|nr:MULTISPECIES: dihydrofolate reductase [unclassified Chelatococcus]MBS7697942.1 dihydrofolate reductase [Chelatococcus sp. YT9]MBX3558481.1 dihydrofolate reductase [Chelatococcus sp.]
MTKPLALIAAVADNGVIGGGNRLLWHLRTDLQRFRRLTQGRPLLMGRNTYDSIGRPLPGRAVVVLTRDPAFAPDGVVVAHDLMAARLRAEEAADHLGADTVMVAGGGEIYALTLPYAQRLYLTRVHVAPAGDTVFPAFDTADFRETLREEHAPGPHDDHAFTFIDYERGQGESAR